MAIVGKLLLRNKTLACGRRQKRRGKTLRFSHCFPYLRAIRSVDACSQVRLCVHGQFYYCERKISDLLCQKSGLIPV